MWGKRYPLVKKSLKSTFIFDPLQVASELLFIELLDDEQLFLGRSNDAAERRLVELAVDAIENNPTFDLNDLLVENFGPDNVEVEQLRPRLVPYKQKSQLQFYKAISRSNSTYNTFLTSDTQRPGIYNLTDTQ